MLRTVIFALLFALITVLNHENFVLSKSAEDAEKFEFQAEVSRMMDIIINSLYQKKEIFLREIISNSADALDKVRFLSLQNPSELDSYKDLEIRIGANDTLKTLTVRDSGIGMTRQELIDNLGTVAKSGTTNFVEQLANTGDLSLIGQFGVGFYSVYLVADRVTVRSKSNKEDEQYIWESTADSTFTIRKDTDGEPLGRGTEITMYLKEEASEYLQPSRLRHLVERYSEFVGFPIYLYNKHYVEPDDDEYEEDEDEEDLDEDDEDEELDEDEEDEDEVNEPIEEWSWDLINEQRAIWTRSPNEIDDDEYINFYKALSKSEADPLTWTHFRAEGEVEFKSLIFVPKSAPYNQYDRFHEIKPDLKLYVRRVLITDEFEDIVPRYLNFIKGVIDSDDLPLAVSRETLQQTKAMKVIGKKVVRKTLDLLAKMAQKEFKDDEDEGTEEMDDEQPKYSDFYEVFGKNLKIGYIEDQDSQERLAKLLRFKSTNKIDESGDTSELTSLEAYVQRMQPWQKSIFYLTGEDMKQLQESPFLVLPKSKGIEVLLMDDPIDEYVLQSLKQFEEYDLVSLATDNVKFGDESELQKKQEKEYKKVFKGLKKWLKKEVYVLEDQPGSDKILSSIEISASKVDENLPAVVTTASYGNSATMERLMKSQAMGDTAKKTIASAVKTLQLNPRSPIINRLNDIYEEDEDTAKDLAWLLLDTALVNSGFDIQEKRLFGQRMYRLMQSSMQLDSLSPMDWIEVPEEEEELSTEDDIDLSPEDETKDEL